MTLDAAMGTGGGNVPIVLILTENDDEDRDGACLDSAECRKDGWGYIPYADGESRNRGGQLPILILTEESDEDDNLF